MVPGDLVKEGLKFLGWTICYALMPATGVVKTIS